MLQKLEADIRVNTQAREKHTQFDEICKTLRNDINQASIRIKQLEDEAIGRSNIGDATWGHPTQSGSPIPATPNYTPTNLDSEKPKFVPKPTFDESPAWQPANINTNPNGFTEDVSNGVPLNPDDRPTVE